MSNEKLEIPEKVKEKSSTMRPYGGGRKNFWKECKQINRIRFFFPPKCRRRNCWHSDKQEVERDTLITILYTLREGITEGKEQEIKKGLIGLAGYI